jgi:hypothetical protein
MKRQFFFSPILFIILVSTSCKKELKPTDEQKLLEDNGLNSNLVTTCIPYALSEIGSTSLPTSMTALAAAAAGNKIVFANAGEASEPPTSVDKKANIYNVSTGTWSTHQLSYSTGFGRAAAGAGSKIAFGGGFNNADQLVDKVDMYDVTTNQWSLAHLTIPRLYVAGVGYGNQLFFGGGGDLSGTPYSRVDIYNETSNAWSTAELSQARCCLVTAATDNKVAFAGGSLQASSNPGDVATKRVDIYDVVTGTWSRSSLSVARYWLVGAALGTTMIFAGGLDNTAKNYNLADIYDTYTGQWTTTHLHSSGTSIVPATIGTKIIFFGKTVADIYDICSKSWSTITLSKSKFGGAAASTLNKLLVAGVQTGNPLDIYTSAQIIQQ